MTIIYGTLTISSIESTTLRSTSYVITTETGVAILPTTNAIVIVPQIPYTITMGYLSTIYHSPAQNTTIFITVVIDGLGSSITTTSYITTITAAATTTSMTVIGEDTNILIVPIIIFFGLAVLIIALRRRK
jgi:hypothetical protein